MTAGLMDRLDIILCIVYTGKTATAVVNNSSYHLFSGNKDCKLPEFRDCLKKHEQWTNSQAWIFKYYLEKDPGIQQRESRCKEKQNEEVLAETGLKTLCKLYKLGLFQELHIALLLHCFVHPYKLLDFL